MDSVKYDYSARNLTLLLNHLDRKLLNEDGSRDSHRSIASPFEKKKICTVSL